MKPQRFSLMYHVHSPMLYRLKVEDGKATAAPPRHLTIGRVVWLAHAPKQGQVAIDAFVENIGEITADAQTLSRDPVAQSASP